MDRIKILEELLSSSDGKILVGGSTAESFSSPDKKNKIYPFNRVGVMLNITQSGEYYPRIPLYALPGEEKPNIDWVPILFKSEILEALPQILKENMSTISAKYPYANVNDLAVINTYLIVKNGKLIWGAMESQDILSFVPAWDVERTKNEVMSSNFLGVKLNIIPKDNAIKIVLGGDSGFYRIPAPSKGPIQLGQTTVKTVEDLLVKLLQNQRVMGNYHKMPQEVFEHRANLLADVLTNYANERNEKYSPNWADAWVEEVTQDIFSKREETEDLC